MDKEERLKQLKELAQNCYNCELGKTRKKLVFGEGNSDAIIMFIGEAPGKVEDEQGRPFVGRSGQLLRRILLAIDIDPLKDVYINNIVQCRPPQNREPSSEERDMCIKFLHKRIKIIQPELIVLLGKTAVRGMCPDHARESIKRLRSISKYLGDFTYYLSEDKKIPVIVTYHPSALLRSPWRKEAAKEDFRFIHEVYKRFK